MRWRNLGGTGNVDDRRARSRRVGLGGVGGVGVLVVLFLLFLGGNDTGELEKIISELEAAPSGQRTPAIDLTPVEFEFASFAGSVLGDLDLMWSEIFTQSGLDYHPPTLVLFRDFTDSACGGADERVGPHYCPLDSTIYLDETFFEEILEDQLEAGGGDFADAYVIAHEVGHHVQNELGITERVRSLQQSEPGNANSLSIDLELQADCFAGVWAFRLAQRGDVLDPGDIEEAIDAAAAVSDDRVQAKTAGMVTAETWTHGSSEQRIEWFDIGYRSGDPDQCSTFREG